MLGGLEPYSYSWDFGDGSALTGAIVQHVFSNPRQYTVTLTVDDSSMESRTVQKIVAVGSWNAVVNCSPVLTTIEEIIGPKGINRNSSDPNSIGADYTGGGFQLVPNLQYNPQSPANPTIWPFYKRAVNLPPDCAYGGIPAFVELHNVGVRTVGIAVTPSMFPTVARYTRMAGRAALRRSTLRTGIIQRALSVTCTGSTGMLTGIGTRLAMLLTQPPPGAKGLTFKDSSIGSTAP